MDLVFLKRDATRLKPGLALRLLVKDYSIQGLWQNVFKILLELDFSSSSHISVCQLLLSLNMFLYKHLALEYNHKVREGRWKANLYISRLVKVFQLTYFRMQVLTKPNKQLTRVFHFNDIRTTHLLQYVPKVHQFCKQCLQKDLVFIN